jgi:uncharacterized protein YbjT (DUF2867 family)
MNDSTKPSILLTGATGAIGGRLLSALLDEGFQVRAMVRSPDRADLPDEVEVVKGDVISSEGLEQATRGIDVAYYLIHSMGRSPGDFEANDRLGAANFANASRDSGVSRIIYLGGLKAEGEGSAHLRSRDEVAEILSTGAPQFVHARAAMVVGADSASFTMLSQLVHRLPVMIGPKWIETRSQPVAVGDVVGALVALATFPDPPGDVELGGADILSYRQMMETFADSEGRRRPFIIPVPVISPRLSSYWVRFVTSVDPALARPLIDGLKEELIVRNAPPAGINDDPLPFDDAVAVALAETESQQP